MDETTKNAVKVLIKSISKAPRQVLNSIFTPVISLITGVVIPWLANTFGFISANIFPIFSAEAKIEIVFWFQVVAFTVTIISGVQIMVNKYKNKKKK